MFISQGEKSITELFSPCFYTQIEKNPFWMECVKEKHLKSLCQCIKEEKYFITWHEVFETVEPFLNIFWKDLSLYIILLPFLTVFYRFI